MIAATSIAVRDLIEKSDDLRRRLHDNAQYFRERLAQLGFTLRGQGHPLIPVMLGDLRHGLVYLRLGSVGATDHPRTDGRGPRILRRGRPIGSEVGSFAIGDRVSGEGHITCGYCRNCHAGRRHVCRNTVGVGVNRLDCFAEYVVIPAFNAFQLRDIIDDDIAAILDPLGNAVHSTLAFDVAGEDVSITGAGPIGIMATAVARFVGARHIVTLDVNDYRLALNVQRDSLDEAMRQLGMREGFDVGLEMSASADAFRQTLQTMQHGGSIALLGIPPNEAAIDWNEVIFKGLTIKSIYGRQMFETGYTMSSLLQSGLDIRKVITRRPPYHRFDDAFRIMRAGRSGKIVMEWT